MNGERLRTAAPSFIENCTRGGYRRQIPDFRKPRFRFLFFLEIFSKNRLGRYRIINNKGVLERPGTKWKVLRTISSTLKFQYFRKLDFLMPCKTKSAENLYLCLRIYGPCRHPGHPQTPSIRFKIVEKPVFVKKSIFQFVGPI